MNRYQEYIHASQHVGMGCGPMGSCSVCRASGFGDVSSTFEFGVHDVAKIAMVATVSTIFAETFIKPFLIPYIKKFFGEKTAT